MAVLDELKRRSVIQTAALYIAIAWGGTEILAFLIEALWGEIAATVASKYLAILFIAGFPVAMYLAWSRDLGRKARRLVSAVTMAVFLVAVLVWLVPSELEKSSSVPVSPGSIKALAVLPLDNLSADPDQDFFALGMTEALITDLSKLSAVKVISRTSVMRYKGTTKPLSEIARELGVDAIVEGSVLRAGNRIRITAQLIEATTDHNLWADSFEGEMQDVLALQSEAAHAMVRGIGANMDGKVVQQTEPKRVDPDAYDAYLKAQILALDATDDTERVIKAAEQVIELDPSFAPGYAFLSDLYGQLALMTNVTDGDAYLRARQLARKSIELDPELPFGRIAMARVHFQFEWDWESAQAEFERVLELDRNNAYGLAMYGAYSVLIHKDCDGGLALLEAARDRDPFNSGMHFDLGVYNFHCRRPDESIKHLQRTNELLPSFFWPRMFIAYNYVNKGQFDRAADQCDLVFEEVGQSFDQNLIGSCAWVYALADRESEARQSLKDLQHPPAGVKIDPIIISWVCVGLEDFECTLEQLEEAYRQRSSNMIFLRTAPAFDPIRNDPRFQAIVDRMDFPH
jgi:TolB-like protein/Tfp pilus assembly protein PilF